MSCTLVGCSQQAHNPACFCRTAVLNAKDLPKQEFFGECSTLDGGAKACSDSSQRTYAVQHLPASIPSGHTLANLNLASTFFVTAGKQPCYCEIQLGNGTARSRTCKGVSIEWMDQQDFAITAGNQLKVIDDVGEKLFEVTAESELKNPKSVGTSLSNPLVAVSGYSNTVSVYKGDGSPLAGFPKTGREIITVTDVNGDKKQDYIILTESEIRAEN